MFTILFLSMTVFGAPAALVSAQVQAGTDCAEGGSENDLDITLDDSSDPTAEYTCIEGGGDIVCYQDGLEAVDVAIQCPNREPTIDSVEGATTVIAGDTIELTVTASDPDTGETPSLSQTNTTTNGTFQDNGDGTGTFTWATVPGDGGEYFVNFTANDGNGGTHYRNETLTVHEPVTFASNFTTPDPAPLVVNFTLTATDWDNVTDATFDAGNGSEPIPTPAGLTGSGNNRYIEVTYTQGTYTAWFNGTEHGFPFNHGISSITALNNAPYFEPINPPSITLGQQLQVAIIAKDTDTDQSLTLTLDQTDLPDEASFDETTGTNPVMQTLTWTPVTISDVGTYYANFTANDGMTESSLNITITVAADDVLPGTVTNLGAVPEGRTQLNVSWTPPSDEDISHFKVYYHTQSFNVTDEAPTNVTTEDHYVVLTGLLPDTTYSINVTTVDLSLNEGWPNEPGVDATTAANAPPQLHLISDKDVVEEQPLVFTVTADDTDGDVLTFAINATNATGSIIDSSSGEFSWTPGPADAGEYYAHINVTDGYGGEAWQNITITVAKGENNAPVFDAIGHQTTVDGLEVAFLVQANDADGDTLSYTIKTNVTNDASTVFTDNGDDTASFAWTPGPEHVEHWYYAEFSVNDNNGAKVTQNITITVNARTTSFESNVTTGPERLHVTFWANITDWTGVTAAFDSGNGSTLVPLSGTDQVIEVAYDEGTFTAWFNGTHPQEGVFNHSIDLSVAHVNEAPVFTAETDGIPAMFPLQERDSVSLRINATDADGESLTYTYTTNATGAIVTPNATGGLDFAWTTNQTHAGQSFDANFTVDDDHGGVIWKNVTFTVTADTQLPGTVTGLAVKHNDTNGNTQLNVSWTPPGDEDISHFKVYYHTQPFNVTDEAPTNVTTTDPYIILTDLTPNTVYYINVTAVDASSQGNEGWPVEYGPGNDGKSFATQVNKEPDFGQDITNKTVVAGHSLEFPVHATDGNSDDLTYTLRTNITSDPSTVFMANGTGVGYNFSWTPSVGEEGEYYAEFSVTDGFDTTVDNITITVDPDGTPPTQVGNLQARNESRTSINVSWNAPAGDVIDYYNLTMDKVPFTPGGTSQDAVMLHVDTTFYVFTGLEPGTTYYFNVSAIDPSGNEGPATTGVSNSTLPNHAPQLDSIGDKTKNEGETLRILVSASDQESDPLGYQLVTDIPDGEYTYAPGFGPGMEFTWVTDYTDSGTYYANFTVTDGYDEVFENVTITMVDVPNTSPDLNVEGNVSIDAEDTFDIGVIATDADGDTLQVDITTDIPNGRGWMFTDDLDGTGNFTWVTTPGDVGSYYVNFTVTDGNGSVVWENVTLDVNVPSGHVPPFIGAVGDAMVEEGEIMYLSIAGQGREPVTYTMDTDSSGFFFESDKEFSWFTADGDAGTYYANFTIEDAYGFTAFDNVTLTVTEFINTPPALDAIGDRTTVEGDTVMFDVNASDADDQALLFGVNTNVPGGHSFDPDGEGNFTFSWTPGLNHAGTYYANFTVDDSYDVSFENVTITVTEYVNAAPVLDPIGDRSVEVEDPLTFKVNASDAEHDAVVFGIVDTNITSGHSFEENQTAGGMDFSWTPSSSQVGWYYANFSVRDGFNERVWENITITVRPSIAPVLDEIGDLEIEEGDDYDKTLTAVDPGDEATLVFSLISNSTDAYIVGDEFRFEPAKGDAGWYWVNVTVTDDDGLSDSENFTVTVKPYTPPQNQELDSSGGGGGSRAATDEEKQALQGSGLGINEDEDVEFLDDDGDGDIDSIKTATGRIQTAHDVDSLDVLVIMDAQTGAMAVMDFQSGKASPVKEIPDQDIEIGETESGDDEDMVAVTVPKETGWIHIVIDDPAPGQNITSLERSDGVILELDQVWRTSDGRLHLIDDPETTYTFGFEPLPKETSKVWLWILLSVLGALVLAGGIWGGIYLYHRPWLLDRFRKGTRAENATEDQGEWHQDDEFDHVGEPVKAGLQDGS